MGRHRSVLITSKGSARVDQGKLRHVKRRPDELPEAANFDQCVGGNLAAGAQSVPQLGRN